MEILKEWNIRPLFQPLDLYLKTNYKKQSNIPLPVPLPLTWINKAPSLQSQLNILCLKAQMIRWTIIMKVTWPEMKSTRLQPQP